MDNETLRKLQLTETEILSDVDRFCQEKGIAYSLYAGTLLGAVRHQGFIPWDDDIDICMTRREYDRFVAAWTADAPEGYVLQNKETDPLFSQSFTKIRKDHTTFFSGVDMNTKEHQGIFLDVFPVDRMPNGKLKRGLFYFRVMRYQLYMREFVPPKSNPLTKCVSRLFLWLVPVAKRPAKRADLLRKITQYNDDRRLGMVSIETVKQMRIIQRPDWLEKFTTISFEGREFPCCECWDDNLRSMYGDYMQLPPPEERVYKHAPKLISFDKNLDEIVREGSR